MLKMLGRQDTEEMCLTEEELERELEISVLNRMRSYLCDHLEPERFFPYLQTKEYLDQDSCEQIRNAGTTKSRTNKMLDVLIKSGPQPLKALTKAIQRSGPTQKFILEKLREENDKIHRNPQNVERLMQIRARIDLTHPFRREAWYPGPPPPYTPYTGGVVPHTQTSIYPPSEFHHPMSTPSPRNHNKVLESRNNISVSGLNHPRFPPHQHHNGNLASHHTTHIQRNYYPKPPVNANTSVVPSDPPSQVCPSHFQTSDFPPGSSGFLTLPTPANISTKDEIVNEQIVEEQKISLLHSNSNEQAVTLTDQITASQEKELVRFQSTEPFTPQGNVNNPWIRSPRTPTENDASVIYSRVSPSNISSSTSTSQVNASNDNDSSTTILPSPSSENPPSMSDISLSTRPKNLKSYQSCQNVSIQPSCFTSSSYGDFESRLSTIKSSDLTKPKAVSPTNTLGRSPVHRSLRPLAQLATARQFSTPLEPIPSVEMVPSVETVESQSITIRRPPTEHEDGSIVEHSSSIPDYNNDGDSSSLEISSDSDTSEL